MLCAPGSRQWALGPCAITDLLVAAGEARINVAEHAYGPESGMVTVHGELPWPDLVTATKDRGRWRLTRGGSRVRGSRKMRYFADGMLIDRGSAGATVVIRCRLIEEAV